jgi:hypothetical protein
MKTGTRVQIAPHYDLWMMGARYGTVTRQSTKGMVFVKLDKITRPQRFPVADLTPID